MPVVGLPSPGTGPTVPWYPTPPVTLLFIDLWPLGSLAIGFPLQGGVTVEAMLGVDLRMGTITSEHLLRLLKMALRPKEGVAFRKSVITPDNSDRLNWRRQKAGGRWGSRVTMVRPPDQVGVSQQDHVPLGPNTMTSPSTGWECPHV